MGFEQLGLLLVPVAAWAAARLLVAGLAVLNRAKPDAPHVEYDVKVVTPRGDHRELRGAASLPMSDAQRAGMLDKIGRELGA